MSAAASWRPRANPWLIALVVTSATFMEVLDSTIVNVSLPHIAGSLSVGTDQSTWALTSYLVANGIVLPVSGWFGDRFGRKRYFMLCIAMFSLFSLLCGAATSLAQLIVFRLAQGFFGGGLQPNQQSIVLDTFPPSQRARAFATTAVAVVVAPILGPTLGGIITDNASWRWVFFINVPIGVLAFLAVGRLVEDPPWLTARRGVRHIDFPGLGLIALGLGCLQIVLDRGEQSDWFGSPTIRAFALVAALGILGAIWWLSVARHPVVDLSVLANRNFAIGMALIFAVGVVLYGSAVLIPELAEIQLGYTATWAGLVLSPGGLAVLVAIPVVGRLLGLVQTRILIGVGFTILGFALLAASRITPQVDFRTLAMLRVGQSLGLAFLFVPISTIAFLTVPRERNGDAAALYSMARNIGGSAGISLVTALIATRAQVHQAALVTHLTPLDRGYRALVAARSAVLFARGTAPGQIGPEVAGSIYRTLIRQAGFAGYLDTLRFCGLLSLGAVGLCFLLDRTRGRGAARAE